MNAEKLIAENSISLIITIFNWIKGRFFRKSFKWSISYDVTSRIDIEVNTKREYQSVYSFIAHDLLRLKDMIRLSFNSDIDDKPGMFSLSIELGRSWHWPCKWIWPWPWSWSRSWYVPKKFNWRWPWFWEWPWYYSKRLRRFGRRANVTFLVYPADKFEKCDGLINSRMENSIWFGLSKTRFKEIINRFSSGESLTVVISNIKYQNSLDDYPIILRFDLSNFKDVVQRKFSQIESIAYDKKMMRHRSTNHDAKQ
ncbi:MAG: hypothetical protein ISN28_12455 [Ectothiorhodospiraceae bacterium AqS1]|nr:hypothetical protein [Ectothiorhodospiraceae bacterium AqS1]